MFRNNLKIIFRNLAKSKAYSFINITGLAIGMAVSLLIGLWIMDEVSFNHSFTNHKKIAQVMVTQYTQGEFETGESVAPPVGPALKENYPADIEKIAFASYNGNRLFAIGEKKVSSTGMIVESSFPDMFTLKISGGNAKVLDDPTSMLISRSLAQSLFGNAEAVGKVVKVDNDQEMKVGGVYEDLPHNSFLYETKYLLPWGMNGNHAKTITDWDNHSTRLYVQLSDATDANKATAKVKNLPTPHITQWHEELVLQPLDKTHLYSEFVKGKAVNGLIRFVWMFGLIGIFVLLLACINFMNLSTARSEKRAKEVGIRKSVGALRGQVIRQFLGESVLVSLLAFVLAIALLLLALPFFNSIADKEMVISWSSPLFWLLALGFTILTGIIAGSYPAFYLSAFQPVKVLKGAVKAGRAALLPRRILVVLQFTVSIALIIGTIVVFRQVEFAKSRPSGYAREGLITIPLTAALDKYYESARTELIQKGFIENMAASSQAPTKFNNNNGIEWRGMDPAKVQFFRDVNITPDFGKTIGWKIQRGRDLSRDFLSDSDAVIINESTAKFMGFENPLGEVVKYSGHNFTIVGVVNDMITQSPYEPMQPSIFFGSGWRAVLTLRLKKDMPVSESLAGVSAVIKKYDPEVPFNYQFVDDQYARKFSDELRVGNLAAFFAVLAIFISCLGLFGLASFVAEQRTKEIGVRKVLGASVFSVWKLLSKEFIVLTLISFFISIPIAYYFMYEWLQNYQYRSPISWWIFAATAAGALLITLLTISFQAIKAGIANPIRSLRTE